MVRRAEVTVRRPRPVTVVTVLVIAAAVVALIMAVALVMATLVPRDADEQIDPVPLLGIAAWCLVGGVGQLVGGVMTVRGSNAGRIVLCSVLVLHLVVNGVIAAMFPAQVSTFVFALIVTVPLAGLLWTPRANGFFTGRLRSSGRD